MNHSKVHSKSDANISVPFKWEKKPGVSKLIINTKDQTFFQNNQDSSSKLPLPPCWSDQKPSSKKKNSQNGLLLSSYCSFQPPLMSCSKREKDPFLMAFKECTKIKSNPAAKAMMIRTSLFRLCRNKSCGVVDDALVKNQVLATYD